MQRLTRASCTNPGIDVGDLTQKTVYDSLCNTLCNMLCNILCMLCNMLYNIAYSRFTSGAIKSRSTKGRVSSRISITSEMFSFVFVDVHVVKVGSIVFSDLNHELEESTDARRSHKRVHTAASLSFEMTYVGTSAPGLLVTKEG